MHVLLPVNYYQVWDPESQVYRWDDLGFRAYCADLSRYPSAPTNYLRQRLSQFLFHADVARSWGMDGKCAFDYARRKLEAAGLGYQQLIQFGSSRG
jgi:hypothetical protein